MNSLCRTDVMTCITLGEVHNITFSLQKNTFTNIQKYWVPYWHSGAEVIGAKTQIANPTIHLSAQVLLDGYDSQSLLYCKKILKEKELGLKFSTWTEPFSYDIWVVIFTLFLFTAFVSLNYYRQKIHALEDLLNYAGQVFGYSGRSTYIGSFVVVWSIGFILTQLYSNGLTSLTTVAIAPKGLETVREFF